VLELDAIAGPRVPVRKDRVRGRVRKPARPTVPVATEATGATVPSGRAREYGALYPSPGRGRHDHALRRVAPPRRPLLPKQGRARQAARGAGSPGVGNAVGSQEGMAPAPARSVRNRPFGTALAQRRYGRPDAGGRAQVRTGHSYPRASSVTRAESSGREWARNNRTAADPDQRSARPYPTAGCLSLPLGSVTGRPPRRR
jgi:hypothetical protein